VSYKIDDETRAWLKTRKLEISTPMFNGVCDGRHRALCISLTQLLAKLGVNHRFTATFNESLITRGRNKIACKFLLTDCTDLLFLDSDIWILPEDVLHLLILSKSHGGILCAPYAKKGINWDRIGKVCSQTKEYPVENMPAYGGTIVANFLVEDMKCGQPVPVRHSGTGVMMIPRSVFDAMICRGVVESYKFMAEEMVDVGAEESWAFFEAKIDPETRLYLSEDWYFCERAKVAGITTWLCPWMVTKHIGPYEYEMNIPAIAETGERL
jgi:hypothetical protein